MSELINLRQRNSMQKLNIIGKIPKIKSINASCKLYMHALCNMINIRKKQMTTRKTIVTSKAHKRQSPSQLPMSSQKLRPRRIWKQSCRKLSSSRGLTQMAKNWGGQWVVQVTSPAVCKKKLQA